MMSWFDWIPAFAGMTGMGRNDGIHRSGRIYVRSEKTNL